MKNLMIVTIILSLMACGQAQEKSSGELSVAVETEFETITEDLSPKAFAEKLADTPDKIILDVRTQQEVDQGIIEGAVHIDFYSNDFREQLKKLPKDKQIFVYCAAGGRSSNAMHLLGNMGYPVIYNLEGGFSDWKEMGLPIK
jgi:phage shock protein E